MSDRPDYERLLVAGGRDFRDAWMMWENLSIMKDQAAQVECLPTVINGDATGADQFADCCAQLLGMDVKRCPADWKKFGKAAGGIRNQGMIDTWHPTHGLILPGGRGTGDMASRLKAQGIPFKDLR